MVVSDDQTTGGSLSNGIWIESIFRLVISSIYHSMLHQMDFYWKHHCHCLVEYLYLGGGGEGGGGGGGGFFLYILLNKIQTMFSQPAKWSARVLPADLCTDHVHYVKNHRLTVLKRNKTMAAQLGTFSHYYISVIHNFFDFMSLLRHSVWFSFSVKQFPSAEFGIFNI